MSDLLRGKELDRPWRNSQPGRIRNNLFQGIGRFSRNLGWWNGCAKTPDRSLLNLRGKPTLKLEAYTKGL